jgi:hypothetical protein
MTSKLLRIIVIPKSLIIFSLFLVFLAGYVIYHGLANEVDDERFGDTLTGMNQMVEMMKNGNIEEGKRVFNQVHAFFHDVDPMLRENDPALAEELWNTVTLIEGQFGSYKPDSDELVKYGEKTIALLQEAKGKLK